MGFDLYQTPERTKSEIESLNRQVENGATSPEDAAQEYLYQTAREEPDY